MKTLIKSVAEIWGITIWMLLVGCASYDSQPRMPPTQAGIRQELIGNWYKSQAYVRGESRPPAGDEIEYRPNGTCTYYITSGRLDPNRTPSSARESWPGH